MTVTGFLKLLIRLPLLVLWTIGMFSLRLCARPLTLIAEPSEIRLRSLLFRVWGRGAIFLLGGRIRAVGPRPRAPFLLVSNHLSYVDIVGSAALLGSAFVAKSEIARWPVIGFCARHLQTLFINRDHRKDVIRVKDQVWNVFQDGYGLHIFAEGGISQNLQVQPFKPALFDAAVRNRVPVHYVAISYRTPEGTPPPSETVAWLAGKSLARHLLDLLAGHGFEAVFTFCEEPVQGDCRKTLADELTSKVRTLYSPVE